METTQSTDKFVHLHCHSHFSLLDGASPLDKLVTRAKDHGMNALALTDHGNLSGSLQFYSKCKSAGINPILGYEAYIAPGSRLTKQNAQTTKEASYHLTLLAQNQTGFKNLIKMASSAYLEGFYFKPRIDKELLEQYSEGIICLSGCVSSEFSRAILRGHGAENGLKEAEDVAAWFSNTFKDRFYVEVMNNGVEIQRLQLEGAVSVADRMGIPVVATSDAHYVDREDADAQDILLCINTGKARAEAGRMKMDGSEFFLRSPTEMYEAFPGLEHAVARSQEIADTVDIDLDLGKRHFPTYPIPADQTASGRLRELCEQGLRERYADAPDMYCDGVLQQVVIDRLDRELGVIDKLGFPNYFLIVWDFVREARERGIPTTARGSGVGALVCFALYLSHVCPIKYDLLFERFLDPNRLEAPDIDIDFCKERRAEIIRFVKDKYGEENVAQIGTFGTLAARAAIKDVGRALSIPIVRVNQITAMVPDQLGISISEAIEKSDELNKAYRNDSEVTELLDLAMKIEGLARNMGTHAAAVVIADQPLTEYVPLCRVRGKEDIITQWAMNDVEDAGLLKMDFLGLRNLTILRKAVDLIQQTTGKVVDPQKFPLDDQETFDLLCRGETKGIFQLESGGIRDLLQKMKPDHFRDIIATNALYRPGPLEGGMVEQYVEVKHGRRPAEYLHPVLEDVLGETNGVMVYQEQVMRILNRLGDIELAKAYTCIKAISKKKESIIQKNRAQFLVGATEKGLDKKQAEDFWEMITKFAGYGFNKSHSTAYALIAYQTAYLKAHYPVEFMAALLSGDIPGRNFQRKDSLVEHLEDCSRMGIEVIPPCVNQSGSDFTVKDDKIHFGFAAVKGCGSAGESLEKERKEGGPFSSIYDLCERVSHTSCGAKALECLVAAGALDCFGYNRRELTNSIEKAIEHGKKKQADRESGQLSLFGAEESVVKVELERCSDFEERELLNMEKDVLGFYLTSHPLAEYKDQLALHCTHKTTGLTGLKDRAKVRMGGMLSALKHSHTKNGRPGAPTKYVNFDLEDVDGAVRCILWPDDYVNHGHLVEPDAIVLVAGVIDRRGDEPNIIVNEIIPLDQVEQRYTSGVIIRVDEAKHELNVLPRIREVVRGFPGDRDLELLVCLRNGSRVRLKSQRMRVEVNGELQSRLDHLLGPGNFKIITRRE